MKNIKELNAFLNKRMFIVVFAGIIAGLLFSQTLLAGEKAVSYLCLYHLHFGPGNRMGGFKRSD